MKEKSPGENFSLGSKHHHEQYAELPPSLFTNFRQLGVQKKEKERKVFSIQPRKHLGRISQVSSKGVITVKRWGV